MIRRRLSILLATTLLLAGCVIPTQTSPSITHEAGAAEKRGDWAAAAELWQQAIEKENGFWKPEFSRNPNRLAVYYYELGRSLGVLAKYDVGEQSLLQALALDEKHNGPKGMDLVELARLNHARGNNARAASYFDQILPRMDEAAEADPAAYITLLNEAAEVYQSVGQNSRATELKSKADNFAAKHPNARFPDNYGWTPYKTSIRN